MTTPLPGSANAYLRTQVMSASPEELRLMLIDGAIKFTKQGREGLLTGNHEQTFGGFSQARAIISELMTSMKPDVAPELCERVRSLYSFMYAELVSASLDREIPKADRVLELLAYERETWVMLMQELKRTGITPAEAGGLTGGHRPISVQG
ncbi:MAG: flagellar export chaperone FliS [Phycisphaerales bacterium]